MTKPTKGSKKPPKTITVGRGRQRRELPIIEIPFYLSPEEDKERIERLSRKIWDCIMEMRKPKYPQSKEIERILGAENDLFK